ncbi:hypothetical protein [Streptomyces sp. NPDC007856]|uniref:hypothetical protein n=1 Tax=Streptomyces sp. NPDC007856 TaxID=3364781 RepID=UPI0036BDDBF0
MGSFFKECEHPRSRWSKCPHPYKIRYRSAAGKQMEESGFADRDKAIGRLTEIYNEKKAAPRSQSKAERIQKYGSMRFEEYVEEWKAGQRHLAVASVRHLDSLLEHHLYPALASRRMNSFDHKVVDGFIRLMERNGAGLATQANAFDKRRAILLDAHRLGVFTDNPVADLQASVHDQELPRPRDVLGPERRFAIVGRRREHFPRGAAAGPSLECRRHGRRDAPFALRHSDRRHP